MNKLEKRMYSLNLYNISGIQCGIQSAHSNMEYALKNFNNDDFQDWANNWKTVILLNGGTSNSGTESYYGYPPAKGTMELHLETLLKIGINVVPFYEPDLNYCMTSMSFIVDEIVFNKKDYPDFDFEFCGLYPIKTFKDTDIFEMSDYFDNGFDYAKSEFDTWVNSIGGINNFYLRLLLNDFKLSSN